MNFKRYRVDTQSRSENVRVPQDTTLSDDLHTTRPHRVNRVVDPEFSASDTSKTHVCEYS